MRALARQFEDWPEILDADLRAETLEAVMIPTLRGAELEAGLGDIKQGDGRELEAKILRDGRVQRPKLHSVYSSSGLALNTFGLWRLDPSTLTIVGRSGFEQLRFECKLPIFRGGHPPNLDLVATAPGFALAVESKLTEHLSPKSVPKFSDAYDRLEAASDPSWWTMYRRLKAGTTRFVYLDGAQIVKHYFGLKRHCEKNVLREASLLYLYWEPDDADQYPELLAHTSEVEQFRAAVSDSTIGFEVMTYPQLWASWDGLTEPEWLAGHLDALRRRYRVSLG